MSGPLSTYSLPDIQLTLGGYRIDGWASDGGIEYEVPERGTITNGADGHHVFNRSGNRSMTVTITVLATSLAYKRLSALMVAQDTQNPIQPLAYLMTDPNTGDSVSSQDAVFTQGPAPSKGAEVAEAQFTLFLPQPTVVYGASIS